MNDLSTQQIILLSLLVAFVTSIATGISVVSLMRQEAEPVTQTINRVVERTVEKIVESEPKEIIVPGETRVERVVETIVVNQEDLTVDAVSQNAQSIVRFYTEGGGQKTFRGIGLVVNENGDILTDASLTQFDASIFKVEAFNQVFRVKQVRSADGLTLYNADGASEGFVAAQFGDSDSLKLAQTVISISGSNKNTISTGIIANFTETESGITNINTNLVDSLSLGSVLLNLNGQIVGMRADGSLETDSSFTPSDTLSNFVTQ